MQLMIRFASLLLFMLSLSGAQEKNLDQLLFQAIQDNDLATVKTVLEQGADANARQGGLRPLHVAAIKGHADIASLLIEHGADIFKEAANFPPIHLAVRANQVEVIAVLLNVGVPIETTSSVTPRHTPLQEAIIAGANEAIYFLIEQGADINNPDQYNDTPLNIAAFNGNHDLVKYLIGEGVELSVVGFQGNTAIDWAEQQGFPEIADSLRQAGATN